MKVTEMPDISSLKPEQKSINKVAIVTVFLFAGTLFIWQFIEEDSIKNLSSSTQTHQIKSNSPKIKRSAAFSNKTTLSNSSDKTKKFNSKARVTSEEKSSKNIANTNAYRTKEPSKRESLTPISKKITTNNLNLAFSEMPNISSPFEYKKLILNDRNTPEKNDAPVDYQTLLLTDQETPKTNKHLKQTTNTESKDYSIQVLLPKSSQQTDKPFDQTSTLTPKVEQQTSIPNFDIKLKEGDLVEQNNSFSKPIEQPKIKSASIVTTDPQGQSKIKTVHLVKADKPRINKVKKYKIKQGDTLYSLSRKYNVSLTSLLQSNTISKKSRLKIGQIIIIPLDS
ncbi:MAG: LysM domain-containing protein [Methylococcaceae bacterium]